MSINSAHIYVSNKPHMSVEKSSWINACQILGSSHMFVHYLVRHKSYCILNFFTFYFSEILWNLQRLVSTKRSHILKQTCSFHLQVCLSMYKLLYLNFYILYINFYIRVILLKNIEVSLKHVNLIVISSSKIFWIALNEKWKMNYHTRNVVGIKWKLILQAMSYPIYFATFLISMYFMWSVDNASTTNLLVGIEFARTTQVGKS